MTQDEMLDVCFFAPLAACLRAKPTRALVQLLSEHFDQNAPTPLALSRAVVALASTEFPGFPDLVECLAALGRETVSERPHNDGAPTVRELTGIPPSRTTYFTDVATFLGRRRGILIARDSAEWKEWEQY
ncbi:MAG: hypothetical protein ABMA14_27650, partial [Hyphomonadaceae bacterium]